LIDIGARRPKRLALRFELGVRKARAPIAA
jgi:hypothetical protein